MLYVCLCCLPQEAIALFQKWGPVDGLFLVRLSTRDHGYYVLSVVVNTQIYHYQIRSRVIYRFYSSYLTLKDTVNFLRCCFQRTLLKAWKHNYCKHKSAYFTVKMAFMQA